MCAYGRSVAYALMRMGVPVVLYTMFEQKSQKNEMRVEIMQLPTGLFVLDASPPISGVRADIDALLRYFESRTDGQLRGRLPPSGLEMDTTDVVSCRLVCHVLSEYAERVDALRARIEQSRKRARVTTLRG
jgi:hypothetical protein